MDFLKDKKILEFWQVLSKVWENDQSVLNPYKMVKTLNTQNFEIEVFR